MVQGAAKEAGILRQMAVVAPNRTAVLLPFALRLFYIWCEKRTTNPAPHSLRRARQWQKQWQMALRADYAPVVDVRSAKTKSGAGKSPEDATKSAVLEAAKYSAKAAELTELGPATTELHWQLRGKRLTAMSRELGKYVKQGDISEEEMMDSESKPLPLGAERLEIFADWFEDVESYVVTHLLE